MKNLWNAMLGVLLGRLPKPSVASDPAVYLVETSMRKYCGVIIYQDDVMIKLQCAKPRTMKILKANIERITIVRTEAARQFWQWQKEKANTWKLTTFP